MKKQGLYYVVYLVVMAIVLTLGAVINIGMIPAPSVSVNFSNIINFLDIAGIVFVLAVCLIALLCTKSLRPLKDAFLFLFRGPERAGIRYEDCLLAVKTTMAAAAAAGVMMFLMSVVNILKGMDLSGGSLRLGTQLATGLLTPIYSLVVAFILLPVYVALKRRLAQKGEEAGAKQHIVIPSKHKNAG